MISQTASKFHFLQWKTILSNTTYFQSTVVIWEMVLGSRVTKMQHSLCAKRADSLMEKKKNLLFLFCLGWKSSCRNHFKSLSICYFCHTFLQYFIIKTTSLETTCCAFSLHGINAHNIIYMLCISKQGSWNECATFDKIQSFLLSMHGLQSGMLTTLSL